VGIVGGPLNRLVLFATEVAKGTASSLMNILTMAVLSLGTQLTYLVYLNDSNLNLGLYCALCGLLYLGLIKLSYADVR
jgi:DHA1 family multidrug/chloramphenicol efflux transport protein-like MFS transporter